MPDCITVFDRLLTAETARERIMNLAERYPALWVSGVGKSILGHRIECLRVGNGAPRMLYVAAHHGMEWITGWMLLRFAEIYLATEAKTTTAATRNREPERGAARAGERRSESHKLPQGTFYLVPLVNPDGVELATGGFDPAGILAARQLRMNGGSIDFSRWQANARGVDLNHNYDADFYAYRAVERALGIGGGAPTRYSGVAPLSEPESACIASLTEKLLPDGVISLHTQGREIFCGRNPAKQVVAAAHILGRRIGYRVSIAEGAAAYGGLTDWLCMRSVPALTVECGSGTNPLPLEDAGKIWCEIQPILFAAPRLLPFAKAGDM